MILKGLALVVSILLRTGAAQNAICPAPCKCAETTINCVGESVVVTPTISPGVSGYDTVLLSDNRLTSFTTQNWPAEFSVSISRLQLNRNALSAVNLTGLSNLTDLDLSHNVFSRVEHDQFQAAKKLMTLVLQGNRISQVDRNSFLGLSSLKALLMDGNLVSTLGSTLVPLVALQELYLANNVIRHLNDQPLRSLNHLTRLDLSYNKLTGLGASDLFGLGPPLRALDLRGNEISGLTVGSMEGLMGLRTLDLTSNDLPEVPVWQLAPLARLEVLSLARNTRITEVPGRAFFALTELLELDMSYCSLLTLDSQAFHNLGNLKSLYLTRNNIRSIADGTFAPLTNLKTLDLSHNDLGGEITRSQFVDDHPITSLYLEGNTRLEGFETGLFSKTLTRLTFLQLSSDGRLSCTDLAEPLARDVQVDMVTSDGRGSTCSSDSEGSTQSSATTTL